MAIGGKNSLGEGGEQKFARLFFTFTRSQFIFGTS